MRARGITRLLLRTRGHGYYDPYARRRRIEAIKVLLAVGFGAFLYWWVR